MKIGHFVTFMHIVIQLRVWCIYLISHSVVKTSIHVRADSRFALLCTNISHWLFSYMPGPQRPLIIGPSIQQTSSYRYYTRSEPFVFKLWYLVTTASQKSPYKSLVCLNNRSLNIRYALHIFFYEPRDPTSMQFKQQSTDWIVIITIRGTTDILAMVVAVI